MAEKVTIKVAGKIREVERAKWDGLLDGGSPFMKWDWLDVLEQTGCAVEEKGWVPQHIVIERDGEIVAACPMYLKLHSMGEFVFDFEWAQYARMVGVKYYPKMLVGVPFTPVTGTRFLTARGARRKELIQLIGEVLKRVAREHKLSSIHVNFCLADEVEALREIGFLPRTGMQFQWENQGYRTFDDYLGAFRSDRRNKIKRERRELLHQGIAIQIVEGEELTPARLRTMFGLYKAHVDRLTYGRQYLTRAFFEELSRRFAPYLCLIVAERDSRAIAGTLNVQDRDVFYGRYWGAHVDERYLHFNVCYYSAIEHCIARELRRFEAGAGGSFKQLRGLEPQATSSMHYVENEPFRLAVERYLVEEREAMEQRRAALGEKSQLK